MGESDTFLTFESQPSHFAGVGNCPILDILDIT